MFMVKILHKRRNQGKEGEVLEWGIELTFYREFGEAVSLISSCLRLDLQEVKEQP